VNFDGSEQRRLTPWELDGGDHPGFSPDGTILFRSYEHDETKQSDYWTVSPDGSSRQCTRLGSRSSPGFEQ
jgi:TolB protein